MLATVWQILNMKCIQSPETEMLYICFNDDSCLKKIVKSHQVTLDSGINVAPRTFGKKNKRRPPPQVTVNLFFTKGKKKNSKAKQKKKKKNIPK